MYLERCRSAACDGITLCRSLGLARGASKDCLARLMLSLAQCCSEHAADLTRDTLCCSGEDGTAAVTVLTQSLDASLEIWQALYWEYSRAEGQEVWQHKP